MKNILSLFDGMCCGQIALSQIPIRYEKYYASEIDKYAIKVTQHNFPNTIQLGDVKEVSSKNVQDIDLLLGGSPCQGFSFVGKQLNFEDPRSKLVLEYIRLYNEIKPKYFLLENVVMKKEHSDVISDFLGVQPVKINSANFSAQNRNRLYWTNIPILPYTPSKVTGKDITECGNPFVGCADKGKIVYEETDKSYAILARDYKGLSNFRTVAVKTETGCRKFTPLECERLQTVPDNYTNVVSDSQRIKMLGNGWTVAVIKHILKGIKDD